MGFAFWIRNRTMDQKERRNTNNNDFYSYNNKGKKKKKNSTGMSFVLWRGQWDIVNNAASSNGEGI